MTACKFTSRTEPRVVPGEHFDECPGNCEGCWPCSERHCSVCTFRHVDNAHPVTCPSCVGDVREDLDGLGRMAAEMLDEAMHRGVESEAAMLAGPAADVETWQRRQRLIVNAALATDDITSEAHKTMRAWVEDCRDEQHPLWVLGGWDLLWREHLEHHTDELLTVESAVGYLCDQLTYMAQQEEPEFSDFAREIRQCRSHLEDVLRDGEQRDTGAPCMTCNVPLVLTYGNDEAADSWQCPRCRERSTTAQYLFAVQNHYRANATSLTASDIAKEYDIPEGSVRGWASEKVSKVRKRGKDHNGRQLYDVGDVLAARDGSAA